MIELISSFKKVDGKILVSALTGYRIEFQKYQKFGKCVDGYLVQRVNEDLQGFSYASAYQYKILRRLIGCHDLKSVNMIVNFDFYAGMGNYFFKTIPELVLGNLLFLSEIKFHFLEIYDGAIGFSSIKITTFFLPDIGIFVDIYADTSGHNDHIFVEIRCQEINQFNPSKVYMYEHWKFKCFNLQDYINTLFCSFRDHDICLNPKILDLEFLLPELSKKEFLSKHALYAS